MSKREKKLEELEERTIDALLKGVCQGQPSVIIAAAKYAVKWPKEHDAEEITKESLASTGDFFAKMLGKKGKKCCKPKESNKE